MQTETIELKHFECVVTERCPNVRVVKLSPTQEIGTHVVVSDSGSLTDFAGCVPLCSVRKLEVGEHVIYGNSKSLWTIVGFNGTFYINVMNKNDQKKVKDLDIRCHNIRIAHKDELEENRRIDIKLLCF